MSDAIKLYAVVEFDEVVGGKKTVELIPTSWLFSNDTTCFWPPKDLEPTFTEIVKNLITADETWDTYPVTVISKAKDFEQGMRRLQKSFKKRNVDSSENDSQQSQTNNIMVLNSSNVTQVLADARPLIPRDLTENTFDDLVMDDPVNNHTTPKNDSMGLTTRTGEKTSGLLPTNRKEIANVDALATHLEDVIRREFKKMRQSLELSLSDKFKDLLKTIQYSAEDPKKQKAWQELGTHLPFDSIENFLTFDESLKEDEEKVKSLVDIFQMVTAGSTNCENDVPKIIAKLMTKTIQLQYSACGKKVKGVGKNSFKDTQSFKVMQMFLQTKYHASQNKLQIISWVSRFLAGAKDREGGRAHRETTNQVME